MAGLAPQDPGPQCFGFHPPLPRSQAAGAPRSRLPRSRPKRLGRRPEPAAPDATPSQEFRRLDTELRLAAALAELPSDYQEVIVLRNLERLPFDEVGRRMDRSRPAAQMLWMRAMKKLRETMGEDDADG